MGLYEWRLHILLALVSIFVVYKIYPFVLFLVFGLLSILCGAALAILRGGYERRRKETYPPPPEPQTEVLLSRVKVYPPPSIKPTLLSPNVDKHVKKVIYLNLKHHAFPTYEKIGWDQEAFFNSVTPEVWNVLAVLLKRAGQIDTMKLITQDIVEALRLHFEHFRGLHFRDPQLVPPTFPSLDLYPYLESPERELNFLRQASEVLLCVCLSKENLECTPIRILVREYLACRILQPTIEMICDPDYINQKMVAYFVRRQEAIKSAEKKYTHSSTYEGFMKHIKKCDDISELQQIRQSIITDIIQAKAVHKMKTSRATGLRGSQFPIAIPADKAKVLMERDLELYITQLGTSKTVCERQIRKLGGVDYDPDPPEAVTKPQHSDVPLGVPFETIMRNETARGHFLLFLENCGFGHLLRFWIAVEDLSLQDAYYKGVKTIYDGFLSSAAADTIYADRSLVDSVEKYLRDEATSCADSLDKMQRIVYEELLDQFYHSFIISENYRDLMLGGGEDGSFPPPLPFSEASRSDSPYLDDSRYKQKLKSLKTKLEEKDNELAVMPESFQSSSLSLRRKTLQKDRSVLKDEIKKLEHYIEHTEEWFGTVGKWSIEIHSIDLSQEKDFDRDPLFVIVVHRPTPVNTAAEIQPSSSLSSLEDFDGQQERKESNASSEDVDGTASELSEETEETDSGFQNRAGWVVGRQLSKFQELHSKVTQVCPHLQFPPLPKRLNPFQKPDAQSKYWQKYIAALQSYLCAVLKDDRLQESEEVFNFLSPASDDLRKSSLIRPGKKRHTFPITVPGIFSKDHEEGKDESIADHMYLLLSEVFELDDWSRVLRKQLMELVQLTFGKSIDRELQEFTSWVVSEPMLIFYLETFRNAMWPKGNLAPPAPTRSDEQKHHTKEEARKLFLKNSPQALQTVLGQRNCQIGYQKMFNALQDPRANKQLFYSLFEILLYALVPELDSVEIDESPLDWEANN